MLDIRERTALSTTVLELTGRLQFAAGEETLRERVGLLVTLGRPRLTLDLRNVSVVDAAGLGTLVWAKTAVERSGGKLALANPGPRLRRLLEITRLDGEFDIVDNHDRPMLPREVSTSVVDIRREKRRFRPRRWMAMMVEPGRAKAG